MTLAVALVIVGVWGYYHFSDLAVVLRVLMVLGGLIGAAVVAWFTVPGKELFAFVVVMALFLFAVDSALAYVVKLLTGRAEG